LNNYQKIKENHLEVPKIPSSIKSSSFFLPPFPSVNNLNNFKLSFNDFFCSKKAATRKEAQQIVHKNKKIFHRKKVTLKTKSHWLSGIA